MAGEAWPSRFCIAKEIKKGEKQRKTRKSFQPSKSFQNVAILAILERLEFKIFLVDNVFQYSMAPLLWNPFHRPFLQIYSHSSRVSSISFEVWFSLFQLVVYVYVFIPT